MNSLDPSPGERRNTSWVTGLAGAYLVLLYVAACAIFSVFGYVRREQIPGVRNYFPTHLPTPTSTPIPPHILVLQPPGDAVVLADNFNSNIYKWSAYSWSSKVEVLNGRLFLLSNVPRYFGIAKIGNGTRVVPDRKYYLQADFATDVSTADSYGMVFGLDATTETFYLFEVTPQTRGFQLMSHSHGNWKELVPSKFASIKPFPESNTLSVYYDHGNIELYINGSLVTTYLDPTPHDNGLFGSYVNDSGFTLIVDNYFAYNDK
jgi:hypothetical protein